MDDLGTDLRANGHVDRADSAADGWPEHIRRALPERGFCFVPAADVRRGLGVGPRGWARFAAHWEDLGPDPYAAETGTLRMRRYGHLLLSRDGRLTPQPHDAFVQPENTNQLYIGKDRAFEPLTDAFLADPLLTSLIRALGVIAGALVDADRWSVKVHPFRVVAAADSDGQPTPEGRHRDGVTLVTSMLVDRRNVTGGASTVYDKQARPLFTTTLGEPGELLLGDDRDTLHSVSPLRPAEAGPPAYRDVLVTTLTEC
ncbi:2OG-Fe dioxygenase family protein [Streptomyces sp. URMC 126]|uniref:2OG-Fe dioxygenase family protein n=1 Tax=Streptomyces sp. URMC 126 TaxID=3423401 RepID=UPI003F1E31A6